MKKIPVAQASEKDLTEVVLHGLSFEQSDDYDEDLVSYSHNVMEFLGDAATAVILYPRAMLAFSAIEEHRDKLLKIGALEKMSGGVAANRALFHAAAHAPLKISIRDGQQSMKLHYDTLQFINIAKHKAQAPGPPSAIAGAAHRTVFDDGTMAPTIQAAKRVSWDELTTPGTPFQFDPEDWPDYADFRRRRQESLLRLDEEDRTVFCQTERDEGDPLLALAANIIDQMPPELCMLSGLGPWALYPPLEECPSFEADAYAQIALSSPWHAVIPCEHGELPVHIFTRLGKVDSLHAALKLVPEAIDARGLTGRTPLMDAIQQKGHDAITDCLLSHAPDLSITWPSGMTYLRSALDCRNWHAISALLDAGYPVHDDTCCDQRVVRHALNDPECPADLRIQLSMICDALPEVSEFSAEVHELQRQLEQAKS